MQTAALRVGSPAVDTFDCTYTDAGGTAQTLATDARGATSLRPQPTGAGSKCDSGSFESHGFTLGVAATNPGTPQSALIGTGFTNPLVAQLTANDPGVPVNGVSLTFAAPGSGASATLNPANGVATTDTNGKAQVTATANGTGGGPYNVTAAPTAATAGVTGTASFALTNTLPTVTLTGMAPTTVEGGNLGFTVTLSPAVNATVTVPVTFGGTAAQGTNYSGAPSNVTFNAGVTSQTITLATVDNTTDDPTLTVTLTLGTPTNATLGAITTLTGTITDNDPGTARPDGPYTVVAGTTLTVPAATGVLANDTYFTDAATPTLTVSTAASHGMVTLHNDGSFTYTPTTGYSGADSFRYTIGESDGTTSNAATVSLTITAPPVAVTDTYTVVAGQTLAVPAPGVLANDALGNPAATVAITTQPAHNGTTLSVAFDGSFTYIPVSSYIGSDSFTYTLTNSVGTSVGTVNITVTGTAPTTVAHSYTVGPNSTLMVTAANGVLSGTTPGNPAPTLTNTQPAHGSLSLSVDGSFTYNPTRYYVGADSFTYTLTNGAGMNTSTVSLTVNGTPPVAMNDGPYNTPANTMLPVGEDRGCCAMTRRAFPPRLPRRWRRSPRMAV